MSVAWIDLAEASRRSGLSQGAIRRECSDRWLAAGLARKQPGVRGGGGGGGGGRGRSRWLIREDADPRGRFARARLPHQIGTDLRAVPAEKRKEAIGRKAILDRWASACRAGFELGFNRDQATQQFLDRLLIEEDQRVSRRTLYNWERRYRDQGLAGLVDGRGREGAAVAGGGGGTGGDDPFFAAVRRMFLDPRRRPITACHTAAEELALERGWELRSYHQTRRHIAAIPRQLVIKMREGDQAFKAQCEPAIERDYESLAVNALWSSDHRPIDVLCEIGRDDKGRPRHGRPNLTIWMDARSRRVLGWAIYAHAPNSDVILRAFRDAVRTAGVPARVEIDNGEDFKSSAIKGPTPKRRAALEKAGVDVSRHEGAMAMLGVECAHCWKYHGQSKPAEAQFRTVSIRFDRLWDTWTGHKTTTKPEDLKDALKRGKAPTLDELREAFAAWLASDYNARPHSGHGMDGRSPDEVFEALLDAKRVADEALLDFACMPRVGPVRVRKQGVTHRGLNFGANDETLQGRYGQNVMLAIDNDDLSRVLVLDLDGRLICSAAQNQRVGFAADSQDLRDAIAEKKKLRQRMKQYMQDRPRMADDVPDLMLRAAARKAAERNRQTDPPPDDAPISPVRTALDDQLPALRRALERREGRGRVAAGGEEIDLESVGALLRRRDDDDVEADSFAQLGVTLRARTEDER